MAIKVGSSFCLYCTVYVAAAGTAITPIIISVCNYCTHESQSDFIGTKVTLILCTKLRWSFYREIMIERSDMGALCIEQ